MRDISSLDTGLVGVQEHLGIALPGQDQHVLPMARVLLFGLLVLTIEVALHTTLFPLLLRQEGTGQWFGPNI